MCLIVVFVSEILQVKLLENWQKVGHFQTVIYVATAFLESVTSRATTHSVSEPLLENVIKMEGTSQNTEEFIWN